MASARDTISINPIDTIRKEKPMSGKDRNLTDTAPKKRYRPEYILVFLVLLSVAGIALTDVTPSKGFWYWMAMAPVFCGAIIAINWSRIDRRGESKGRLIWTQVFRWFGYLATIYVVFILSATDTGLLNNVDAGLIALLILAFATFSAGIGANWQISAVGVFLGIAVVIVALVEEYIWALLIPLALVVIAVVLFRRWRSRKAQAV